MDSPQDATSLLNVVNFIVGFLQTNAGGALAALLGGLAVSPSTAARSTSSLNIPESSLEQLFQQVGQLAVNHAVQPSPLVILLDCEMVIKQ